MRREQDGGARRMTRRGVMSDNTVTPVVDVHCSDDDETL